ncbi:hypothetical protein DFQ15_10996 [Xylophilus ampelinus]|uniref:Uncharacterized protein n=1 Tax=Xylophilus ampelinus TaxID=54067 RepID=A0A318SH81_9BURK|nr:hypothetical protein DFQ15_10996 [Xylophilus ampelinus]
MSRRRIAARCKHAHASAQHGGFSMSAAPNRFKQARTAVRRTEVSP